MATICLPLRSKGIKLNNVLNHRNNHKKQTNTEKTQELMQRMESLKTKISILRQQCETLKAAMNKPQDTTLCSKCGQPTKRNETATFKTDAAEQVFCKKCFTEMWK
jgi:hypothetical protein